MKMPEGPKNQLPSGRTTDDLPADADRTGLYFAALFYDISTEGGLGDYKADQLLWKTISLITDVDSLSMREFGDLMLDAAAAMWPDAADPTQSIYHDILVQVMASRGIPTGGAATFQDLLPAAIGDATTMTLPFPFDTVHPNKQPAMSLTTYSYNSISFFENGYTEPDAGDFDYISVNFYKHSKSGPGDKLILTDGSFFGAMPEFGGDAPTFGDIGDWRSDGSFGIELTDREVGNVSLMIPGDFANYSDQRARVANESIAPSTIDVHAFGWIATQSMKNGFSIDVQQVASDNDTITYQVSIVDPSLAMTGSLRTGAAAYDWVFADFLGQSTTIDGSAAGDGGQVVQYTALRDEPFELSISRTRNGIVDTLELVERGNDFARDEGKAFYVNAVDLAAVTINAKTTGQASPGLSGAIDDPAAVVEVWVQTEAEMTFQTAQVYQATNHGDGTWSLPAGTIDPLALGTYEVHVRATVDGKLSVVDHSADELVISLIGDVDLDGTVGAGDFGILAAGFDPGAGGKTLGQGDVNDDGDVDLSDFGILAFNFGNTTPSVIVATSSLVQAEPVAGSAESTGSTGSTGSGDAGDVEDAQVQRATAVHLWNMHRRSLAGAAGDTIAERFSVLDRAGPSPQRFDAMLV